MTTGNQVAVLPIDGYRHHSVLPMTTIRHDLLFQNGTATAIGSITAAGLIKDSRGLDQGPKRRFGAYALVYSLAGSATYWDERIGTRAVRPGDLFLIFPDIAHRYGGQDRHEPWDEFFIVFHGPLFDCWRAQGLLVPEQAWWQVQPMDYWLGRLRGCLNPQGRIGVDAALQQLCQLQQVLADVLASTTRSGGDGPHPSWIKDACELLADPTVHDLKLAEIARRLGVPPDTLRKVFTTIMGVPPATWRRARLIDEACRRIAGGMVTGRQLAEDLGFSDEYHFSRTFRRITGMTPSRFRDRLSAPG